MQILDDAQAYLPDVWSAHARFRPEKIAVICGKRRETWRELNAGMNRVAHALLTAGVSRGDRVAVLMDNSVDMLHVMFGIAKSGACVVPISTMLTAEQVATMVNDSGSIGLIAALRDPTILKQVMSHPGVLRPDVCVALGFAAHGWREYSDFIAAQPDTDPLVRYRLEDEFNIIYSSGTTAAPKGIVQTHRARQHWSYSNAIEMRFDNQSIAMTTTGLYSNGTWFMLLPPMFVGATIVILEKFSPSELLETIAREKVTHTFMVPTQFVTTLAAPEFENYDLSSLRTILSAGSPLRPDTRADIVSRMGVGLFELYGFTEGFATIIKPEELASKPGSVGRPVVGFDLRILDDEGRELMPGESGEIAGYGAGLMRGYHNNPDATAEAIWRDERGRTFFRSGDIGKVDEDGFLYILDRKKDMILSGGFNVFPQDIEAIIGTHPDVLDVTVIGIPHPKWGEVPLALVIPHNPKLSDADAIRIWANERLAKPQQLAAVEFRDEFPRNALGKVIKRQLREIYWQVEE